MALLVSVLGQLALLLLTLAGLAAMVGWTSARDRLFRWVFGLVGASFLLPYFFCLLGRGLATVHTSFNTGGGEIPPGLLPFVVLGHLVLGGWLLRRRLRGPDHARREATELDQVRRRGRERVRLPPPAGGGTP